MDRPEAPMRWSIAHGTARHYSLWELWSYRELVFSFILRDIHVRYRQTVIGAAWVIIQPVAYTLVFSGFLHLMNARTDDERIPSWLLRFSGAIVWQAFAQGVQQATLCLANNRQLITKAYFPRLLLPISAVSTPLIDFFIGWIMLLITALCMGVRPQLWFLATPLLAIPLTCVSFTLGTWVSMLNAIYRDVASLIPFALQLGLIFTPVMYQTSVVIPERFRLLSAMNPMVTIIDLFRTAWFGQPPPTISMMLISMVTTLLVFLGGYHYFTRMEDIVADQV